MNLRRVFVVAGVAALALIVDQASKWLILNVVMQPPRVIEVLPVFNLTLGFNTGVSFGLFSDALDDWALAFAGVKLAIVIGLCVWAYLVTSALERVGLALIAGGALGNVVDRALQGAVTDFLDVHWGGAHFPTFNMADVMISLGVMCVLAAALWPTSQPSEASAEVRS
jgi:signal peptidase II